MHVSIISVSPHEVTVEKIRIVEKPRGRVYWGF